MPSSGNANPAAATARAHQAYVYRRLGGGKSLLAGEDTPNARRAFADPRAYLSQVVNRRYTHIGCALATTHRLEDDRGKRGERERDGVVAAVMGDGGGVERAQVADVASAVEG